MKPPLRSARDVCAVIEGVVRGAIDAIATDHAPHPGSEKMQEFEQCPFGILGLETALGDGSGAAGAFRQDRLAANGGAVHDRSCADFGARSRHAAAGRARET